MNKKSYTRVFMVIPVLAITLILVNYHNNKVLNTSSELPQLYTSGESYSIEPDVKDESSSIYQNNVNTIDYSAIKAVYASGWVARRCNKSCRND